MTTPIRRRARQADERKMSKRTQWLKGIGGFLIGAIFGLYVVRWFVAFLPGPKIAVDVQGLEATSGNAAGCTLYMFMLNTDEAIDYVYLKIQFPFKITGYKVGLPQEAQTASMGRM